MTIPTDNEKLMQFAAEQAQRVIKKIPLLGPVSWLMMNNPTTRHSFFADLEWRVMPPLILEQAKLYMRGEMPTAFVTWACLSDAVAERFAKPPYQLAPGDWKSGNRVFLIDLIAPYDGAKEVLDDLKATVLNGKVLHQLAPQGERTMHVLEL
ncbi:toxin-activating lysine-acyltransferase [Cupriavidus oxalaticus]|jgi:cytolysin-activating lysine-acyltransferase|uniref:RTX toxin-activating lysine-acyltransferase n=1 Tax=Cupriavidus oxalaticus TaxID=96344 RepID=A0A375FZ32_9BURK|nr:toxin-activating lysine-acyltransferase [Cupriavidus oxalaticus]QEZ48289.1 toxin-activating lysine-acyltransferase [Cupriavidus oxalaticus]QRQ87431.1 toxin-activating lysine-acyltransferase [Cupriavidus oxalaticus]QRQ94241.1 toxin-activating lysine-acyltransferase [Cupriavidus oxalaticus]WQD82878.1 toxin-activating lysine-acyltransferase [Cupriavidus oxalaticus]SPC10799.1 RTX toxin activating acyltransferase [Cupriavidus oxalaticus]